MRGPKTRGPGGSRILPTCMSWAEPYGFRLERRTLRTAAATTVSCVCSSNLRARSILPFDAAILITGDLTDAGTSAEWSEFLSIMAKHPRLCERVFVLPGNHDLNIVDRANPARFDLPTSPNRRLRLLRALSAINLLQGDRVRVVDLAKRSPRQDLGRSLATGSERDRALRRYGKAAFLLCDAGALGDDVPDGGAA